MKLSSIIITRNEQENISECIKNLSFADEVIVIDNNSKDATVSSAKKAGAYVTSQSGLDFSYLRNIGKEKANGEWLLYVDADERIPPSLAKEIKHVTDKKDMYQAYALNRKNFYLGEMWPGLERMVRLMRKDALVGWQGTLHETAMVAGKVGELNEPFLHYSHNNLSSMVEKTNEWSQVEATLRLQAGHPPMVWWRFFRVMTTAFWKSFVTMEGWRLGT